MHRDHRKKYVQPRYLAITVAAAAGAAALSGSCFLDSETNLCEASGRRCIPGQVCAANQDACIPIGGCGDGIISAEKAEVCDDGNILGGDGCSADCKSEEVCGDGMIDLAVGESCDDGNRTPGDGCSADCAAEVCGNHVVDVDLGEVCDDGNARSSDGCSADCKSNEACGNGIIDNDGPGGVLREQCEFADAPFPGPVRNTASCDSDCTFPTCGDGHLNSEYVIPGMNHREQCDAGVMGTPKDSPSCDRDCTFARCGDGYRNTAVDVDGYQVEPCDQGMRNSNTTPDACRTDCRKAHCGDGVVDTGEACDDHNDVNTDLCISGPGQACKLATCGDGFVRAATDPHDEDYEVPEECDDGVKNDDMMPNACRTDCREAFCGDGVHDAGEACDKGSDGPPTVPEVGCSGMLQCNSSCTRCE